MVREPVVAGASPEDDIDRDLRPQRMQDMIGQVDVCERLRIAIDATRKRGEALGHVLFDGPPGLGKTTFAICIPHELGVGVQLTSGAVLKAPKDLVPYLTNAEERSVLFIDEIHRSAAGGGRVSLHGDGGLPHRHRAGRRSQRADPQSVAQAVHADRGDHAGRHALGTAAGSLSDSRTPGFLYGGRVDRAGAAQRPETVGRHRRAGGGGNCPAQPFDAACGEQSPAVGARLCHEPCRRSRHATRWPATPWRWPASTRPASTAQDRRYLETLIRVFGGGPAGVEAVAHTMNTSADTLEDEVEPFLLRSEFVVRTPRGRVVTPAAYQHLQIAPTGNRLF